jgi:hypothetical protein
MISSDDTLRSKRLQRSMGSHEKSLLGWLVQFHAGHSITARLNDRRVRKKSL